MRQSRETMTSVSDGKGKKEEECIISHKVGLAYLMLSEVDLHRDTILWYILPIDLR